MPRTSALALAVTAFLIAAPAAQARDATVTSFDGTPIVLSFFGAAGLGAGQKAPTVLEGHGWGGSRETNPDAAVTRGPATSASGRCGAPASTCSPGTHAASATRAAR